MNEFESTRDTLNNLLEAFTDATNFESQETILSDIRYLLNLYAERYPDRPDDIRRLRNIVAMFPYDEYLQDDENSDYILDRFIEDMSYTRIPLRNDTEFDRGYSPVSPQYSDIRTETEDRGYSPVLPRYNIEDDRHSPENTPMLTLGWTLSTIIDLQRAFADATNFDAQETILSNIRTLVELYSERYPERRDDIENILDVVLNMFPYREYLQDADENSDILSRFIEDMSSPVFPSRPMIIDRMSWDFQLFIRQLLQSYIQPELYRDIQITSEPNENDVTITIHPDSRSYDTHDAIIHSLRLITTGIRYDSSGMAYVSLRIVDNNQYLDFVVRVAPTLQVVKLADETDLVYLIGPNDIRHLGFRE